MVNEKDFKRYELGEKYSKMKMEKRKRLVKQISSKLNKIKAKNKQLQEQIDKLYSQKESEWEIEEKLNLLKHTYKKGDYVVVREGIIGSDKKVENNYKICKVLELKKIKDYVLMNCAVGIKEAYVKYKVNESQIVCHIDSLASIGKIQVYNESWKGKIKKNN